jgi:hypothetical protein
MIIIVGFLLFLWLLILPNVFIGILFIYLFLS